jgi:hypothetical protein
MPLCRSHDAALRPDAGLRERLLKLSNEPARPSKLLRSAARSSASQRRPCPPFLPPRTPNSTAAGIAVSTGRRVAGGVLFVRFPHPRHQRFQAIGNGKGLRLRRDATKERGPRPRSGRETCPNGRKHREPRREHCRRSDAVSASLRRSETCPEPPWHGGGSRFDPDRVHVPFFHGGAPERPIQSPPAPAEVVGSIPIASTFPLITRPVKI